MTTSDKTKFNRIVFFASRPDLNASNRYRIYKIAEQMKLKGFGCVVCPPYSNWLYSKLLNYPGKIIMLAATVVTFINRVFQLRHLSNCHVVVVQQEMMRFFPPFFERLLKQCKIKLIFDFDDANFALNLLSDRKNASKFYDYNKTEKIIKLSDYVFAGSEYLKEYAMRFTDKVVKIPTGIDIDRYTAKKDCGDPLVIGWIGSSATLEYLQPMEEVFEELKERGFDFIVKIVCNNSFHFKHTKVVNKTWVLENEISDLKSFDIGIMPMPNNEFSQAKCGFKIIQYMAVGIPAVSSPVGENILIAGNQESCFLADTKQQWVEKLSLLLTDPALRKTMGEKGRQNVQNNFSIDQNVDHILGVINLYC